MTTYCLPPATYVAGLLRPGVCLRGSLSQQVRCQALAREWLRNRWPRLRRGGDFAGHRAGGYTYLFDGKQRTTGGPVKNVQVALFG
jgi:hypothetical protein